MQPILTCDPSLERTAEGYCIVDITDEMLVSAKKAAQEIGVRKNSILKGKGNLAGTLGEIATQHAVIGARRDSTFDNDIRVGTHRIEVKTKDRTVIPIPDFEVSVADYNPTQMADYYVFVSLLRNNKHYTRAYLVGYYQTGEYFKDAHFIPMGSHDITNNWVASADCYNLLNYRLCVFS